MNRYQPARKLCFADAFKHLTWLGLLVVGSCSHHHESLARFDGQLRYPETIINLKNGLQLKHIAGPECQDETRPEVGTSDRVRTFSYYELLDSSGKKLCESPSGLSDPKFLGEFESYHRENDLLKVYQSASGQSVLIIEDRSPTFPRVALLLLTQDKKGGWQQSELLSPHIAGTSTNIYGHYPSVIGLTDHAVRFRHGEKDWSEKFITLRKPVSPHSSTILAEH